MIGVSYSGGKEVGYSHEDLLPPLDLTPNLYLSYKPSGAIEATRSNVRGPILLNASWGSIPPHPQKQCASHDQLFPLPNKNSWLKPCSEHAGSSFYQLYNIWLPVQNSRTVSI